MSGYTEHYNLKKPAQSENYNVEDANTNNTIIDAILFGKIDKVAGKDLSSNDFTNEYKLKLDAMGKIYNYLGTVQNLDALGKIENNKKGDLYHVQSESADYAWNGTEWQKVDSNKGDTGVGITEITYQESTEDSGVNVITIKLSDNREMSFNIKNGSHGDKGDTGDTGKTGATGIRGSRWSEGTKITGTSTSGTIFSNSGITDALVNDFYLNTTTGNIYICILSGIATVAKWKYVGSLKDIGLITEYSQILKITANTAKGATVTLSKKYKVGAGVLDIYLNGERLIKSSDEAGTDGHYVEVGTAGTTSNQIKITNDWNLESGDYLEFVVRGEWS